MLDWTDGENAENVQVSAECSDHGFFKRSWFEKLSWFSSYFKCMQRFGKRFSLEQLIYRAITFKNGVTDDHNAAVRVKLVGALMEAEVGQVS